MGKHGLLFCSKHEIKGLESPVEKSTGCSCRGPECGSQHPHGRHKCLQLQFHRTQRHALDSAVPGTHTVYITHMQANVQTYKNF